MKHHQVVVRFSSPRENPNSSLSSQSLLMFGLTCLCLFRPSLGSPVLAEMRRLMRPLGPLGHLLQGAVTGGGGAGAAAGGAAGAAGAAGAGGATGGVGSVVGSLPVTTSPVVPAMMMSSLLPGIGIGLLAGSFIAELLIGKNEGKKHQAGYEDQQYSYGYSGYQHDLYGGHHHRGYY